jgi:hypothetical protein
MAEIDPNFLKLDHAATRRIVIMPNCEKKF